MHTLVIIAIAVFMNSTTLQKQTAMAGVDSVTDCARLINMNREPKVDGNGDHWYMVAAECKVIEQ